MQEQAQAAGVVVVGRVGAAHGVKGWLRVASFTAPAENILDYRPWLLQTRGAWRRMELAEAAPRRRDGLLCRFANLTERAAAEAFRGALIGVPEAALPALGEREYYWRDLLGLDVVTVAGASLGRVENLLETGANDALVVRDGERERLVPFVAHVARDVDLQRGVVVVDWEPDF